MPTINENEYGQVIRANIGEDVSTNTALEFIIQPEFGQSTNTNNLVLQPRGAIIRTAADGVVVGTVNVVVDDTTLIANEYLEYTTLTGDFSHSGNWRIKGTAQLTATNKAAGDYKLISVLP